MRYYLGIDAGGTKTHCYVGDESGTILGEGFGGQGNYQLCGADVARISYESAINEALSNAGLHLTDITYAVFFGLSGADEEVDFEVLRPLCKSIVGDIPHEILNDTWIGLRTGAKHGVVSICGTGAAHAGKNRDGQKHILRNLHYELGNMGGGGEVVDQALHYAFRSNEGTYKKTKLEQAIMDIFFEAKTMDEVCNAFRTNDYEVPREQAYHIPIATMKLASEGDEVAKEIISNMGREEGRYAAGVIKAWVWKMMKCH